MFTHPGCVTPLSHWRVRFAQRRVCRQDSRALEFPTTITQILLVLVDSNLRNSSPLCGLRFFLICVMENILEIIDDEHNKNIAAMRGIITEIHQIYSAGQCNRMLLCAVEQTHREE